MKITVNGAPHELPDGQYPTTYEQLVELAGETGTPSVAVSLGDKSRAGLAPYPGSVVELDEGARVTVVHTGNA